MILPEYCIILPFVNDFSLKLQLARGRPLQFLGLPSGVVVSIRWEKTLIDKGERIKREREGWVHDVLHGYKNHIYSLRFLK